MDRKFLFIITSLQKKLKNVNLVTQSPKYFPEVKMSGPKEILTHAQRVCRLYKVSFLDYRFLLIGKRK